MTGDGRPRSLLKKIKQKEKGDKLEMISAFISSNNNTVSKQLVEKIASFGIRSILIDTECNTALNKLSEEKEILISSNLQFILNWLQKEKVIIYINSYEDLDKSCCFTNNAFIIYHCKHPNHLNHTFLKNVDLIICDSEECILRDTYIDKLLVISDKEIPDYISNLLVSGNYKNEKFMLERKKYFENRKKTEKKIEKKEISYKKNTPLFEATIIVMNLNRLECLKNCLKSIEQHTKDVVYELIIFDAGSTKKVKDYLMKEWGKKATLIFSNYKTTYAEANNNVMAGARGKYIYLLNNDCEVTPGWLRKAIDCMEEDKTIGHLASLVLNTNGSVQSHGSNLTEEGDNIILWANKNKDLPVLLEQANYAYAGLGLYREDLAVKVEFLPEYPSKIYYSDVGYGLRIWELGYDVRYYPESKVIHHLDKTERVGHSSDIVEGKKEFMNEWGQFLLENNGFCPSYPFKGKRPWSNKNV